MKYQTLFSEKNILILSVAIKSSKLKVNPSLFMITLQDKNVWYIFSAFFF